MKLKWIKGIGVIGVFILCFICHFIYNWLPNTLTAIFFPVNESIWEHMKLLVTPYVLFGIIDYLLLKKYQFSTKNFLFQLWVVPILGIIIFLAFYLPTYLWIGENMVFSILLLLLVIIFMESMSYYLLKIKEIKWGNTIGIIGLIITYVLFGYLVYHPLQNFLFLDVKKSKYGIHIYRR